MQVAYTARAPWRFLLLPAQKWPGEIPEILGPVSGFLAPESQASPPPRAEIIGGELISAPHRSRNDFA